MDTNLTAGARTASDVGSLLRARNSLIWIVTREEERVERLLVESAQVAQYRPCYWDCATGLQDLNGRPIAPSSADNRASAQGEALVDPNDVLRALRAAQGRQVWVLRDFTTWLRDPNLARLLRSSARTFATLPREEAKAIIVITPSAEIPPELSGQAVVIEWPIPDRAEIAALLESVVTALPDAVRSTALPEELRDAAIDAAVGLTSHEAQSCYARSLVLSKRIDPLLVAGEKKRVIAREKVLEWVDPLTGGLDAVGGLDGLKNWLVSRKAAFGPRARSYGLPAPKGALLVGVPGCGKSLTAKAIAAAWGMPLLRLDLGALKSKWIGESEGNIRKALRVAEAVSPCVLWLDEVEKALNGASSGAADGGVSSDALGVILSWMQERSGSVFVVATANDVSALPPELLRKGRFDELFFVDLPNAAERVGVVRAALKSSTHRTAKIDFASVAAATPDFTGAELAQLIPDALYRAFGDGEREITTEDLLTVAAETVPLAKTMPEKIAKIREWAKGRARPASSTGANVEARAMNRTVDVDF